MKLIINTLTPEEFLADYWQKKPLVIKQGFADFEDLLSGDELAGFATDELVESRLIYKRNEENVDITNETKVVNGTKKANGTKNMNKVWQADFGPFDSYEHLGENDWTLVIQALNNWLPECEALIQCFDFIPRWRFDDVMVSYARPGGSVGPHVDRYDTFICQGSGTRHWRVGDNGVHKEVVAHDALLHVETFDPIIDVVLEAGDVLYIPPGYPHEGVALEESMSFSVGYRTGSAKDMHNAFSDYLLENDLASEQIEDPGRQICRDSGKIDRTDFARIKQQLFDALSDDMIRKVVGGHLTHSKCLLDLPEDEYDYDVNYFLEVFNQVEMVRVGGLRCLYFEDGAEKGRFFVNGDEIHFPQSIAPVIPLLCDNQVLTFDMLAPWMEDAFLVSQLTAWVKKGYWYFDDE